jgi:hypothetical protein
MARPYHLYGRKSYDAPLTFVAQVMVPGGETPAIPEPADEWIEVIAFAESAIVQVITLGPPTRQS